MIEKIVRRLFNKSRSSTPQDEGAESREEYKPKYNTIGHEFLDLEKIVGATCPDYKVLDDIIDEAKRRIEPKQKYSRQDALKILRTIGNILTEKGFEYYTTDTPLLSNSLKGKIDCDDLSIIYLSIAEVLNLPLVGIRAPHHLFVRWKLIKGSYVNWETTSMTKATDEEYKNEFRIMKDSIKEKAFLRGLSRQEVLSYAYSNIAYVFYFRNDIISSYEYVQKSLELNPKNDLAYNTRGSIFSKKQDLDKSISDFSQAIRLDPSNDNYHYNRGCVWNKKGDLNRAISDFSQAILLNSNVDFYYCDRGIVLSKKGNMDEAIADFNAAISLKPDNHINHFNLAIGLAKKGEYYGALASYNEVLQLCPEFAYDPKSKQFCDMIAKIKQK